MNNLVSRIVLLLLLAVNIEVFGHPGHGNREQSAYSVQHYTTEPIHILEWIGLAVIGYIAISGVFKIFRSYRKK